MIHIINQTQRKIRIPIASKKACLMLHPNELSELRQLLDLTECAIEKQLMEKLQKSICWS